MCKIFTVDDLFPATQGDELGEDVEVNRAIMWKKGRVNKEGGYDGDELKARVQKIVRKITQKISACVCHVSTFYCLFFLLLDRMIVLS